MQAEPVFLDREATIRKTCELIEEAASRGAEIIAFPEAFVSGHPDWFLFYPARDGVAKFYREFFKNAVEVPSRATDLLCEAARRAGAYVVLGLIEREPRTMGSLYNTLLFIDRRGSIMGKHRKIVPTETERIVLVAGEGSDLQVYDTEYGELGGLMCGENTNSLARFALLAMGEKIHVANWPPMPTAEMRARGSLDHIDVRIRNHAYEGKIFVITCSGWFGEDMRAKICDTEERRAMVVQGGGCSGIVGPDGRYLAGPLKDKEGIVYAELDMERIIDAKVLHDVIGHYNRFDVFSLTYTRRKLSPLRIVDAPPEPSPTRRLGQAEAAVNRLLAKLEAQTELREEVASEVDDVRKAFAGAHTEELPA